MIQDLPFFHSYDPDTKQLTLRGATQIPQEIFLYADDIEILDVAHGSLTELPANFAQLYKLRIAFFSNNPFTEIPTVLAECTKLTMVGFKSCQLTNWPEQALPPSLRWLVLTNNKLSAVPKSIGELTNIQKLSLAGNQIRVLPEEMQRCQQLELLRLGANQLTNLPKWLFELPRLAWYGDAGNVYSYTPAQDNSIQEIQWNDLVWGNVLGESPSSTVYAASYTTSAVAVKIYKNTLTSDGYINDDIQASILAGEHLNIIQTTGRIVGEPTGLQGTVLALVPSEYSALGLPPSIDSCTRDTFADTAMFSFSFICKVLHDIASACAHLHSRGIMHGDIYAHNILVNQHGHAKLGDFGAASLYAAGDTSRRERIDVRAYGYLIEDLLQRCSDVEVHDAEISELQAVQQACLLTTVNNRPSFAEIYQRIVSLDKYSFFE